MAILTGVHNHEMLPYLEVHLFARRLMEDDKKIVRCNTPALDIEPPPTTQDHLQVTHRKGNIFKQKGRTTILARRNSTKRLFAMANQWRGDGELRQCSRETYWALSPGRTNGEISPGENGFARASRDSSDS
ncbi:hypothetical protein MTR_4g037715 [Medicago truncatula]|uniref:Uncharacterized protein n=1 Tax=Medicago truncatula TaxID=3880 RepID=A0A072UIK0_MEDTR|nr:hypothetical protein MTR_4g037715 [Medicago truncatula]